MKKWRIQKNRDWAVAAFFLLLFSYLAAGRYQQPINEWLMSFSPEKMSSFNQPEHQGVYFAAIFLAAVLFSLLWLWQRKAEGKSVKEMLLILWAGTAVFLTGISLSYHLECRRIVNTPYDTDLVPQVDLTFHIGAESYLAELTEEAQKELLWLCLDLEPLSLEKQEVIQEQTGWDWDAEIQIWYPEYQNHSYRLWFHLKDQILRFHKGHSTETDLYYDGTRIREFLTEQDLI